MGRRTRALSTWLVACLVVSLATIEMPHLASGHHDVDFDLVVVTHDASAHHWSSGSPSPARPEHCLACHWGRSFPTGSDSQTLNAPPPEVIVARVADHVPGTGRAPVAQPPLRSPPV